MNEHNDTKNSKKPTNAPLFADNSEIKSKRMLGLKIIGGGFAVLLVAVYFVFLAASSQPTVSERTQSGRNANMSDPSRLHDELIAAAEAEKHSQIPVERVITVTSPDASPVSNTTQVIVVQAPPVRRERDIRSLTNEELEAGRRYRDMKRESILSGSSVSGFDDLSRGGENLATAAAPTREQMMMRMMENLANGGGAAAEAHAAAQGEDPNAFRHKLDFLTRDGAERTPQG
jgi:hypothetical protein